MADNFNLENYEPVKARKKRFYEKHTDGRIVVQAVRADEKSALFLATLYKNSDEQSKLLPLATGYAQEFKGMGGFANNDSWCENCEESAIGRALDNYGMSGNSLCSREEMNKVSKPVNTKPPVQPNVPVLSVPKPLTEQERPFTTPPTTKDYAPTEKQLKRLWAIIKNSSWRVEEVTTYMLDAFNIKRSEDLTSSTYKTLCDTIQSMSFDQALSQLNYGEDRPAVVGLTHWTPPTSEDSDIKF